ncbi:MAG: YkvA family protein [Alcaligenaceae bacterium]|nr:YkvA family protein [Alcaligenaceae bacterium]
MKKTEFNRQGLLRKITNIALKAGKPIIEKALQLFYAAQSPATPPWARRVIYGALAYLVLPIDAIPDYLPALGFTDDLGVITAALATVASYITPEIKAKSKDKVNLWFHKS